jgi:hypothetical protein
MKSLEAEHNEGPREFPAPIGKLLELTAICERMRPDSHNAETSAECRTG